MQNKGTLYPSFVHYFIPSSSISVKVHTTLHEIRSNPFHGRREDLSQKELTADEKLFIFIGSLVGSQ